MSGREADAWRRPYRVARRREGMSKTFNCTQNHKGVEFGCVQVKKKMHGRISFSVPHVSTSLDVTSPYC